MTTSKEKIEKLFPSVYITLISILLGFAVEDVITRVRDTAPVDIYSLLTLVAILSVVIAAWTGYSFVSMTQERLPKLLDAINAFLLAFGIYLMNSAVGMEIWWFYSALCVHLICAMFATIYNFTIMLQNTSTSYDWRIFKGNVIIIAICLVIYPIAAWLSMQGMLAREVDIFLLVYFLITNILWMYFFYHAWHKLISEVA